MAHGTLPGWYGKLPSLGDFAARRLAPEFVEAWDRWLAGALDHWRGQDPQWLDAYLAAPVWRFVLGGGLPHAAGGGCAGVMMPSVDRVGRYFPLMLAAQRTPGSDVPSQDWFDALEGLAVAAMQDDWDVERLDAALAALPDPQAAAAAADWALHGESLWWCVDGSGALAARHAVAGLPNGAAFAALFGGARGDNVSLDPLQHFDP